MATGAGKGELLSGLSGAAAIGAGVVLHKPDLVKQGVVLVAGSTIKALAPRDYGSRWATRDVTIVDPLAYLPVVYGRARVPARLAEMTSSSDQRFLWMVLPICHGPITGIDEIYLDGRLAVAADGTTQMPYAPYSGYLEWGKYLGAGTQDTTAASRMIGNRQSLTLAGGAGTDTYTLSYAGQVTAAIAKSATPAAVQSALAALSGIGTGNVLVTGTAGAAYVVDFSQGSLANADGPLLIAGNATGGLAVTVASTVGGGLSGSDLIAADPAWDTYHKLAGIAYLLLKLVFETGLYPSGPPQVEVIVRGRTVKDPRTGLVAYSTNPMVCWRDYATNAVYGQGIAEADIDDGDASGGVWAEADYCDEAASAAADLGMWPVRRVGTAGTAGGQLNNCVILSQLAGSGTVSCTAGAATFSAPQGAILSGGVQAGTFQDGCAVEVATHWYVVSNFDGSTHCTLTPYGGGAAPTFAASSFTLAPAILAQNLVWVRNVLPASPMPQGSVVPNGQWPVLEIGPFMDPDGLSFTLDDGTGHALAIAGLAYTGTTQQTVQVARFACAGLLDTARHHAVNFRDLLGSCRADMFSVGGSVRPYIRRVRAAEAYEISQVNTAPDWEWTIPGAQDVPNRLRVTYVDPGHNWQRRTFAWPPMDTANPYLAADNNVINERAIDLALCPDRHQAERIAMVLLEEARAGPAFACSARPEALQLAVDDVVNVSHRTPGWGATEANTHAILSSSVANPTVIDAPAHGLPDQARARIAGHTGSTPSLNGDWTITLVDADHFTVPVAVTVAGTGGTVAPAPEQAWVTGVGIRPPGEGNPISVSGMRYVATAYDDQVTPDDALAPGTALPDPWTLAGPTNLVLSSGNASDPRILIGWDAAPDSRVDHYEIQGRRTASPDPGVLPDTEYRSFPAVAGDVYTGSVWPVAKGEVWDVRVRAVSAVGVPSEDGGGTDGWLELTGYGVQLGYVNLNGYEYAVTTDGGSATVTVTFSGLCGQVVGYVLETGSAVITPPPLTPAYKAFDLSAADAVNGIATQRVAAQAADHLNIILVGYAQDGTRLGVSPTIQVQIASAGAGPTGAPGTPALVTAHQTSLDIAWPNNGDVTSQTRVWVNGIVVFTSGAGASTWTVPNLTLGTAYTIGVDHILNGQALPADGPVTAVLSTAGPAAAPASFTAAAPTWTTDAKGKTYEGYALDWTDVGAWEISATSVAHGAAAPSAPAGSYLSGNVKVPVSAVEPATDPAPTYDLYLWLRGTSPVTAWAPLASNPLTFVAPGP